MSTPERTHLFRCGQPYLGGTRITSVAVASFRDLGFARVDTHRELRQGAPEAILAEGKTPDEIEAIARALLEAGAGSVLVTRADEAARAALRARRAGRRGGRAGAAGVGRARRAGGARAGRRSCPAGRRTARW